MLKRLVWLGPAAVVLSMAAVFAVQQLALRLFAPLPREYVLLGSSESMVLTALFVSAAVLVFAVIAREAVDPVRTYRRVARWALVLSFIPDLILGSTSRPAPATSLWPVAAVFMTMHVVAWAVTVITLTGRWTTAG
jgi:uncharacterized membrane protein